MKGYKAVGPDMTALYGDDLFSPLKYEQIGKTYIMDDDIAVSERGFHFCKNLMSCYDIYGLSPFTIILEVETPDDAIIDKHILEDLYCSNKIKILRRVRQDEIRNMMNDVINKDCDYDSGRRLRTYLSCLDTYNTIVDFDKFELSLNTSLQDLYVYYGLYLTIYDRLERNGSLTITDDHINMFYNYTEIFSNYIDIAAKREFNLKQEVV